MPEEQIWSGKPPGGVTIPASSGVSQYLQELLGKLLPAIAPPLADTLRVGTSGGSAGTPARVGSVANVAGAPPPVPGQTPSPVAAQGGGGLSQGNVPIPQGRPSPGSGEFIPRMPQPERMPNDFSGRSARAGAITQNIMGQITGALNNAEKRDYERKKQEAKYVLDQYYEAIRRGDTETANDIIRDKKNQKILKDALEHQPWEIKENKPNPNYDALKEVVQKAQQQEGQAPNSSPGQPGAPPAAQAIPQRESRFTRNAQGNATVNPRPGVQDVTADRIARAQSAQAGTAQIGAERQLENAKRDPSQFDPLLSRDELRQAARVDANLDAGANQKLSADSQYLSSLMSLTGHLAGIKMSTDAQKAINEGDNIALRYSRSAAAKYHEAAAENLRTSATAKSAAQYDKAILGWQDAVNDGLRTYKDAEKAGAKPEVLNMIAISIAKANAMLRQTKLDRGQAIVLGELP